SERSISEIMCSSTAESAPKDDTAATSPRKASRTERSMISIGFRWPCSASSPAASAAMPASTPPTRSSGLGFASIERLLERRGTDTAVGVDKTFAGIEPKAEIGIDDLLDGIGDLFRGEAAADDLADRGVLVGRAAERHLVELGALLLHAQYADMADMVVAAGV